MAIRNIPPETTVFHFYNANPANKRTADCVIRAISLATGKSWEQVLSGLYVCAIQTKDAPNGRETFDKYLKDLGWMKMPQPRKKNNKKYTIAEFCKQIAKQDVKYVLSVAHHVVCVNECKAWDIWDCTDLTVGNYWYKE